MPLREPVREAGTPAYEDELLISRPSDVGIGHRGYFKLMAERRRRFDGAAPGYPGAVAPGYPGAAALEAPGGPDGTFEGRPFPEPYAVLDPEDDVRLPAWAPDKGAEDTFLFLPYLPFFSNCNGYDSHVSIAKVLEDHPNCTHVAPEMTVPVNENIFAGAREPRGDSCSVPASPKDVRKRGAEAKGVGLSLQCAFEEDVMKRTGKKRWFEMRSGEVLFHLTKRPVSALAFAEARTADGALRTRWGRSDELREIVTSETGRVADLVEVVVEENPDSLPARAGVIPRRVVLDIAFRQVSAREKLLVSSTLTFLEQCTVAGPLSKDRETILGTGVPPCPLDILGQIKDRAYTLEVHYHALSWWELFDEFEFGIHTYFAFFASVGIMTVLLGFAVWATHRVLTRVRNPPRFRGARLYKIICEAPLKGVALSLVPMIIALLLTELAFGAGSELSAGLLSFDDIPGSFAREPRMTPEVIAMNKRGRTGVCFFAVGMYVTFLCASLLVPARAKEEQGALAAEGRDGTTDGDGERPAGLAAWRPVVWKRAHLVLHCVALEAVLLIIWEFSYSPHYEEDVYTYIALFKLAQMISDVAMESVLGERLLAAPFAVVVGASEALVTLGASGFSDFVLGYAVDKMLVVLERLYAASRLRKVATTWPEWTLAWKRRLRGGRRVAPEEEAAEAVARQHIRDGAELADEGVEPLLESCYVYSNGVTSLLLAPCLSLVLLFFPAETAMPEQYSIKPHEVYYYAVFGLCMVPFVLGMDVFLLNAQELVHGWRVHDYLSYQRYRFAERGHRWMMKSPALDQSIAPRTQTLDLLCFSSQHYFLTSLFALGMLSCIFGMTIFLRAGDDASGEKYSPLGDPLLFFIVLAVQVFGDAVKHLLKRAADVKIARFGYHGLWVTKQPESTVDGEVAAKLAVGEGRHADLEQARLELQALDSERFRHRFLERSRPWILQHLVELLSAEGLDGFGPDGRPAAEYIRDVYRELVAAGGVARRPGDRPDISSDEGDEMDAARRSWPRQPTAAASAKIARRWLAKARKRRAFGKLVPCALPRAGGACCAVCGRSADAGAVDRLIAGFEERYGAEESDVDLWQAYVRGNGEDVARCSLCVERWEQGAPLQQTRRAAGHAAGRAARSDISSDEEDDEVAFEPVPVPRSSDEGRMLSKWLAAARAKLGGEFPRPEARAAVERYAAMMREKEPRGGRQRTAGLRGGEGERRRAAARRAAWPGSFDAACAALARRWLRQARESASVRSAARGERLRRQIAEP